MSIPAYEIVTTTVGATSIRDNRTGETMHNPVGPWVEANALYIDQSRLAERLLEPTTEELVIFDVGLGAAANALAALHCARRHSGHRALRLVSFERELSLLQFALDHADRFEHFAGFEEAIRSIITQGSWSQGNVLWELRHGHYPDLIECEPSRAHVVFFDPYSSKKNAEMWNVEVFSKTRAKCADNGSLYTYSCATPVRVALLVAGFFVGTGVSSGPKEETTEASTRLEILSNPLGAEWLGRWGRSHHPNASGAKPEDFPSVQRLVREHTQFKGISFART